MNPSYRKPVGVLGLLLGLILYGGIIGRLITPLEGLPQLLQVPVYFVLGVIWILPLKPLLLWMETGRWRVPK